MDFDVEVPNSENTQKVKTENDTDVIDLGKLLVVY